MASIYRKQIIESEIKTLTHLNKLYNDELLAATLADNFTEVIVLGKLLEALESKLESLRASIEKEYR